MTGSMSTVQVLLQVWVVKRMAYSVWRMQLQTGTACIVCRWWPPANAMMKERHQWR